MKGQRLKVVVSVPHLAPGRLSVCLCVVSSFAATYKVKSAKGCLPKLTGAI